MNKWFCKDCDAELKIANTFDQIKTHLKEKHGLQSLNGVRCRKALVLALDGSDFAHNCFDITVQVEPPVNLYQSCRTTYGKKKHGPQV